MNTPSNLQAFRKLVIKLTQLGDDKVDLEKWKRVFQALSLEGQKEFLTLLKKQAEQLARFRK